MDERALLGDIDIEPPIPWEAIKDGPFLPSAYLPTGVSLDTTMIFKLDEDDGRCAVEVTGRWEAGDYFSLEAELQEMVDTFPGHLFLGTFEVDDLNGSGTYRVDVGADRKVRSRRPIVMWPGEGIIPICFEEKDMECALRTLVKLWDSGGASIDDLSVWQRMTAQGLSTAVAIADDPPGP